MKFLVAVVGSLVLLSGCLKKKEQTILAEKKPLIAKSFVKSQQSMSVQECDDAGKKKSKSNKQSGTSSKKAKEDIQQIEARLSDIPTPLLAKPLYASDHQKGCYQLVYEVGMPLADLVTFYESEMKSMGWKQGVLFLGDEYLASFKKADHSCILSIRPETLSFWGLKKPATVHLYVQL